MFKSFAERPLIQSNIMIMKPPACCVFVVNNAVYQSISIGKVSAICNLKSIAMRSVGKMILGHHITNV